MNAPSKWSGWFRPPALLLLLVVSCTLAACDDPFIDPFVNTGRYYTVWGFLDPDAAEQEIRVSEVTRTPPATVMPGDQNATIDARVFLIHVASGTQSELRHTLVTLDGGTVAHVFRGWMKIVANTNYRVEVHRSDGVVASANTWVPVFHSPTNMEHPPPVIDENGHHIQTIKLNGIPSPWGFQVTYLVQGPASRRRVWLDYGRPGHQTADGGWEFTVDMTADQVFTRADVDQAIANGEIPGEDPADRTFTLHGMGVRVIVPDADWVIPDGEIDVDYYSRPDVLTNVENGYGYVGSILRYTEGWQISNELSIELGWDY